MKSKNAKVSKAEKKKYVLSTAADYEILAKVKQLEKTKLTKSDKDAVTLIRTQLEKNWRKYLSRKLEQLLKKYHKN